MHRPGGATWQRRVQIRALCLQPLAGEVNRCGNIRLDTPSMGAAPPQPVNHAPTRRGI